MLAEAYETLKSFEADIDPRAISMARIIVRRLFANSLTSGDDYVSVGRKRDFHLKDMHVIVEYGYAGEPHYCYYINPEGDWQMVNPGGDTIDKGTLMEVYFPNNWDSLSKRFESGYDIKFFKDWEDHLRETQCKQD